VIYAGPFRSEDSGKNWTKLTRDIAAVYAGNGDTVYSFDSKGGETRVYRSNDRGVRWKQVGSAIPASGTHEITVDPVNADRIYVPANNGLNIWDGTQWIVSDESNGLLKDWYGQYSLRNVAIHPADCNVIFVAHLASRIGFTRGVFVSRDGGESWTDISANLGPEMAVWAMAVDPRHDRLYIGTSEGTWFLNNASKAGL